MDGWSEFIGPGSSVGRIWMRLCQRRAALFTGVSAQVAAGLHGGLTGGSGAEAGLLGGGPSGIII